MQFQSLYSCIARAHGFNKVTHLVHVVLLAFGMNSFADDDDDMMNAKEFHMLYVCGDDQNCMIQQIKYSKKRITLIIIKYILIDGF